MEHLAIHQGAYSEDDYYQLCLTQFQDSIQ